MKKLNLLLLITSLFATTTFAQTEDNQQSFAHLPTPDKNEKVATFAGGCFWALSEGMSELKGVDKVVSGFAGGKTKNPSYQEVCTKTTGHAESVQVYYNPSVISFEKLTEAFFYAHDPTTVDRQGPDEGPDYRSVAFYRTPAEKAIIMSVIAKVNATHHYTDKIVTQVQPYTILYPAEIYHQGYFKTHMDNYYITHVSMPKVMKLRKTMHDELKSEYK